ncbi:MAG: cell division protein FtsL [Rhodobacteraceae bacterium]|nr:cell division protein FtsL [Paracoccaceae bacterium]
MRAFLYLICCGAVIGVAYWAYKENYQTQASIRRVTQLQGQIATERTAISVLTAEWAYLNRPNRLRDLVDLNYNDLQLLPLLPEHFADIELVAYPQINLKLDEIKDPVSVRSVDGEEYP